MNKNEVDYAEVSGETIKVLRKGGLLLVSLDTKGKPNIMTIGWGTIGVIWGKPMFVVLVRHSRHTYKLIEHTGDFTVNVPPDKMDEITAYCGKVSGKDHDKFTEMKLTAQPSEKVKSPIIKECRINYECRVVHKNDVVPKALSDEIIPTFYRTGDFHKFYFGEILCVHKS